MSTVIDRINMYTYNNIDERWTMIGRLVAKHGTEDEKIAWALCRGDAAEWKLKGAKTDEDNYHRDLPTLVTKEEDDTRKHI